MRPTFGNVFAFWGWTILSLFIWNILLLPFWMIWTFFFLSY